MKNSIEYVCTICTEEFVVSPAQWADATHILLCPCCGGTELEPLGNDRAVPSYYRAGLNIDAA